MGCGCNRAHNPNVKNLGSIPVVKNVAPQIIKTNITNPSQMTKSNPDIKKQICKSCQFSTKNSKGIFDDNSRCRKANKSITYILRDTTFHCPMQKF